MKKTKIAQNRLRCMIVTLIDFNKHTGEASFYYELIDSLRHKFEDVIVISTKGSFSQLTKIGVKTFPISPINPPRLFYTFRIGLALLSATIFMLFSFITVLVYYLIFKPHIVLLRHSLLSFTISQALRVLRAKTIADGDITSEVLKRYSALKLSPIFLRLLETLEKITLNSYSIIRASNYDLARRFIRFGIIKEKIWVYPPGIDISRIPYQPLSGTARTSIGFFGYITEWQGIQFFLPIFKELCRHMSEAKLIIIGEGPYLPNLKRLVKQVKLSKNVIFISPMDRNILLRDGFKLFSMAVIPRIGSPGGLPMKMIEAMAAGKPIILFRSHEWPSYLCEDNGVIMIEPDNVESSVKKLIELITNKEKYLLLSSRARSFSQRFDISYLADKIRKFALQYCEKDLQ